MSASRIVPDPESPGKSMLGEIVRIKGIEERPSYITLEDGSEIMVQVMITEVVFIPDRWDNKGEPMYNVSFNPMINVVAPDKLRKRSN